MPYKLTSILYLSLAFLLGCLVTYLYTTKSKMDSLMQVGSQSTSLVTAPQNVNLKVNESRYLYDAINQPDASQEVSSNGVLNKSMHDQTATPSVSDYTQKQAKSIINDMPDLVLNQYVDKFLAKDSSDIILDKRRFAERAIEELYQSNDSQPLNGSIKLSFNSTMPSQSVDLNTVYENAKIFAHLDTNGHVPYSPFVFVKWVNNQTGQVLLFEKKDIVADSNQNWVSFRPDDGWQVGSYDIRFYEFTSELHPIAQLTYHIYELSTVDNSSQKDALEEVSTTSSVSDAL